MMTKHVYKTIIFGAGQIGQMTARLLGNSYQIMCFADNDPRKHGQFIGNIPICSPSKAAALFVRRGEEQKLIDRYRVQLEDYAQALERMTGRKVKERYIYSFTLGKEILL